VCRVLWGGGGGIEFVFLAPLADCREKLTMAKIVSVHFVSATSVVISLRRKSAASNRYRHFCVV